MNESNNPPGSPPPDQPPAGSPPPPPPSGSGAGAPGGAPPPPPTGGGPESPNRGLMIVLSYLGPLALAPLLMEKEDREVQWHAKHGLLLFGTEIAICIVIAIFLSVIAIFDAGCTGCLFAVFSWIPALAILIVHILCIVKGVNGERFLIPGLSQYADKF